MARHSRHSAGTRKNPTPDVNMALGRMAARSRKNGMPAHATVHGNLIHIGAATHGNKALQVNAHHGVKASTHHGPGGIKPHEMKVPHVPTPKSGLKKAGHKSGVVKAPHIKAAEPGKGIHNHLKKVK